MTLRHLGVTLDSIDPDALSSFWSAALGFDDIERAGDYVLLRGRGEHTGIRGFTLQRVPETKTIKNRMHFDVVVDAVDEEVSRLIRLGARVIGREAEPTDEQLVVMADPEGNEFCVIRVRPD